MYRHVSFMTMYDIIQHGYVRYHQTCIWHDLTKRNQTCNRQNESIRISKNVSTVNQSTVRYPVTLQFLPETKSYPRHEEIF